MKITKKEIKKEAKIIKEYLKWNSYISSQIQGINYSFNQHECTGKTLSQICEMLEYEILFHS